MSKVTRTLSEVWRSLLRRGGVSEAKPSGTAAFELRLDGLKIGRLCCADKHWTFAYSEEFRKSRGFRPLVQFPDVDRIYKSDHLWPFFLLRIPSLSQYAVQDIVELEKIDPTDEVALLRRFGKHALANPFELIEVSAEGQCDSAAKDSFGIMSAASQVAL